MTVSITQGQDNIPKESGTFLVYGDPGSAKTPFAGTFGDRTLYINCGDGITSIYSPKFEAKYGKWNGIRVDISEKDQFNPTAFNDICDTIDKYCANHSDLFDTIVIDDAAALQFYAMNQALKDLLGMNRSQTMNTSKKMGYNTPEIQDYKGEMDIIDQFMRTYVDDLKARGKNFVVLALVERDFGKPANRGEDAPVIKMKPWFTGKKHKIPSYFDYIWYAQNEQGKASVTTEGNTLYEARSRFAGIFPEKYYNPNYKEIKHALDYYFTTGKVVDKTFWGKPENLK